MVAEEHLDLSSFLQHNKHATVDHQVGDLSLGILRGGLEDVDDLNGTFYLHVSWYIDQHTVLCQHGVQGGYGILAGVGQSGVVFSHNFRMVAHGVYDDPLRQMAFGLAVIVEHIVDHEKQGR